MLKDYIVRKVIREQQPSVPVPESYKFEGPDGKFCSEIIGCAKGVLLGTVLDELSEQEEEDVFEDLGKHMKAYRQITSPTMGRVDSGEQFDGVIGSCNNRGCIKTGSNEAEWFENLSSGIRKGLLLKIYFGKHIVKKPSDVKEGSSFSHT
jgi:hypothetical protein